MLDFSQIQKIVNDAAASQEAFLVDFTYSSDGRMQVYVDFVEGNITLEALKRISRFIEGTLGEESCQYGIDVSSPGMFSPFKVSFQFKKNMGRSVRVSCREGRVETGLLVEYVEEEKLTVERTVRVPKTVGKGKMDVVERVEIPWSDVLETVVEFQF